MIRNKDIATKEFFSKDLSSEQIDQYYKKMVYSSSKVLDSYILFVSKVSS